MTMRLAGSSALILGLLAIAGELGGLAFPTARWFFRVSRESPWLHSGSGNAIFPWFGWLASLTLIACGVALLARALRGGRRNPVTERRIRRFREIRRGYWSLQILILLAALAALDQIAVGKRALAVNMHGKWMFPAFLDRDLKNKDLGLTGVPAEDFVDYRRLKRVLGKSGEGRVILPPVPFDPTGDTLPPRSRPLLLRDGIWQEAGSRKPYFGLAAVFHDGERELIKARFTLRNGILQGPADGWAADGTPVYSADYAKGEVARETFTGQGDAAAFRLTADPGLHALYYHPSPPMPGEGHWLGTTSQGYDVLAYLYGGLQINFKAAIIYLPVVYLVGITIGMMMGYFGGWFDLVAQRLIEIFSNIPFLFVVIIISSKVPERFKGLPVVLGILVLFGWMGMTYLMRTAAYRDKERDYISAARVLGAGTPRILFRHLLPNTVAIIVTLVPFTMSGLVSALTSLDYLGFGLPPENATWGRLLNDGLSNLSAPWLVSSTFLVLVGLLVLITFVGEAVREAFDPKKFTYYR
jgi:microcin C transport system permease protein